MTTLSATIRNTETAAALRSAGKIPAVIYGKGLDKSVHVAIDREAFKKAWASAGSSTAVTITGIDDEVDAIIHDFQIDPTTDTVIHADLLALDKNTKVTVQVHLEFINEAPAVRAGLGVLEKPIHELEIEALPKHLPKSIVVDLATLSDVGSAIHVKDLAIPTGVELKGNGPDDVVAVISAIKEEKEEVIFNPDAVEVEEKGKKDEGAEGEAVAEDDKKEEKGDKKE